jgi:predicted membrane protein
MNPFDIVVLTIMCVILYALFFIVLQNITYKLYHIILSDNLQLKCILMIPFILCAVTYTTLIIIHTLLAISLGIRLANSFKMWWNK